MVELDESEITAAAQRLQAGEVAAVAVCFMHAYANNENEEKAAKLLERLLPNAYLSVSSRLYRKSASTTASVLRS